MRAAPPVQALSCNTGPWRAFQLSLYALSAGVAAAWVTLQLGGHGTAAAGAALAAGLITLVIAGRWPANPPSRLAWDGAGWVLHGLPGEALAGEAQPMVNLGGWILVRFSAGPRWLALSRRDTADWQALRVALFAAPRARPGA